MRQATRDRTAADTAAAEAAFGRPEEADPRDTEGFLSAHKDFHWALIRPAVGPVGRRLLDQLWLVAERYVRLGVSAYQVDEPARHEHRHLLDAYVSGDADGVAEETARHLQLVEATIREQLGDRLS